MGGSLLSVFGLCACGGSSDGSGASGDSCASIAACGGDIVGTWKVKSECASGSSADISFCPSASVSTSGLTTAGTVTFGADGSYSGAITIGGALRYNIPSSCLTMNGTTASCSDLSAAVGESGDGAFSAVSCQQSGANCVCNFTLTPQTSTQTGTYTTSGTNLTVTVTDKTPETDGYCATSTDLHVSSSIAMNTGMMGTTTVTQVLVATKQ